MNGSHCHASWLPLCRHLMAAGCFLLVTGCHSASLVKVSNAHPLGAPKDDLPHPGKRSTVTKAMVAQHHRGGTPLEVVKQWDAKAAGSPALSNERLTLAEILCDEAARFEKSQPATAVGWYLQAAETAYPGALESQRKGTGSYFTPTFVVEHLLERALDPALDAHLARIGELLRRGDTAGAGPAAGGGCRAAADAG